MNTKRSLLTSSVALLLCFVMLLGTTYAWFTDSVTSSGNKIQSGTLKLDLLVLKEGTNNDWYSIKDESKPLFTYENWEPGYTDVSILKVKNTGNLALKWVAKLFSENALSDLAKVIDVYVLPGATEYPTDRAALEGWNKVGTLDGFINSISTTTYGTLEGGDEATLGIAFKMQETAGNEYQGMTLGDFDIRIVATQLTSEDDSFGPDYDTDSEYPADPLYFSAGTDIADSDLLHGATNVQITIGDDSSDVSAVLPEGVKLADGAKSVKLTVKSADTNSNISLGDGENALSFDVHIDGVAADNDQPMIVNLGAILPAGLTDTELRLFHVENGVNVAMTRVSSANDFTLHNQYTYNEATGELSIYVKSFSVFSAVESNVSEWLDDTVADTSWYNENDTEFILADVADFLGFRDLVDGGKNFAGKTVKLGCDIDLNGKLFDPIGYNYVHLGGQAFMGTFDGANHTIYNLYQNGWDLDPDKENYSTYTYSTAGGGLFASVKDATIKNLAISGANIVFECVDMGIVVGYAQGTCYFDNIVVTDSTIANYNRYTGGIVGEVCKGVNDANGYSHTFTNITVDSSVVVSSLWGSFDTSIGGVIGGKWGDAKVLMQNVNVAAELDVYSDVTAAYQWYAYRRCGMLIGHTEQNSPKKALNAAADFLTCENVNVYYGDWVNYTYYEFTNQNNAWQNNYPWVRAEASPVGNNGAFSNPRYGHPDVMIDGESTEINTHELAEAYKTEKVTITFNQLYGGGQGVYGAADHTKNNSDVTIHNSLNKTIYIDNNLGWSNLKLEYYFANGSDRWSTIVDGADIVAQQGTVYKVSLPAYAAGFEISGTDKNGLTVSTPEIALSQATENATYPLNTFQLSLKVDGNEQLVYAGNMLYNVEINGNNAQYYDVVIYDRSYEGTFATNAFGVAFIIDSNGNIVKIYDAAVDGNQVQSYSSDGATISAFDVNNYATVAWSDLKDGERLVIFPNDGGNNTVRNWARELSTADSIGKKLALKATINDNLEITVNGVTIDGFINAHVVTENNWLYNTQINEQNYPYASHYKAVIYDKSYSGTFTTNSYGVAIVIDASGNIVKAYNAAIGNDEVKFYSNNDTLPSENLTISNYATLAWKDLQDGETLVIFPNNKDDNSTRNWARQICENWDNGISGAKVSLEGAKALPKTIYFQNTQDWENVGIQYWYKDGTTKTDALGSTTLYDGKYEVYRVVLPANVVKVVFGEATIDGDNVTLDSLTPEITSFEKDHIYAVSSERTIKSTLYKEGYKTVYFYNNKNWTNVSLYYWFTDSEGNAWDTLGFPGEAMESVIKDGNYDIYKFVVPSYATAFIISNGLKSSASGHKQTQDISVTNCDGKIYDVSDETTTNSNNVTGYKVGSSTYKEGYTTIYLKNNYKWDEVQAYYNIGASWIQSNTLELLGYDGSYEYYSVEIPNFATKFNFSGEKNDGSGSRQQIKDQTLSDYTTYNMVTPSSGDGNNVTVTKGTYASNAKTTYKQLYFIPSSDWYADSARFAVYAFKEGSGNQWYSLSDKYSDGSYKVWVSTSYNEIILCRMNPAYSTNSWDNGHVWNQTADLTIPTDGKNLFTQTSGWSNNGTWSKK